MTILLVDVDSTIPNLALMKISSYYKCKGFEVELIRCNISYYHQKRKSVELVLKQKYSKVFISCIYNNTFNSLKIVDDFDNKIIYGGTGIDYSIRLPDSIEKMQPDYSIYPENKISYGFITRGCVRNCYFCVVPKKEGNINFSTHPCEIVKHKVTKFLDNNILAYDGHLGILQWLVDNRIKCEFNQGLDIRLLTKENSYLLSKMNYSNRYIFAFDDIKYKKMIEEKMELLDWRKDWRVKFYVYIHPRMQLEDTIERILWLRNHKCIPYIMRDLKCWGSVYDLFFIDLAGWCNCQGVFEKFTFLEFLNFRYKNEKRINYSNELYKKTLKNIDI